MQIKYKFNFTCICPNDKEAIYYEAIIESSNTIMVEDINEYALTLNKLELYQEDITLLISEKFKSKVTTFGTHQGVDIECNTN